MPVGGKKSNKRGKKQMTQVQFRSIYFKVFLPSSGRKQASAVSEGD